MRMAQYCRILDTRKCQNIADHAFDCDHSKYIGSYTRTEPGRAHSFKALLFVDFRYITPPGQGFLPRETAIHHQVRHVVVLYRDGGGPRA